MKAWKLRKQRKELLIDDALVYSFWFFVLFMSALIVIGVFVECMKT